MDWRLVLGLSLGGVVMGLLSSFVGLRAPLEFTLWVLIFAVWLLILVREDVDRPVRIAIAAGALAGLWAGALQTLFLASYATSNPWYVDQIPAARGEAALGFVGMGIVSGVVFGGITGALAHYVNQRRRRTQAAGA